jgi:hypothetical protein
MCNTASCREVSQIPGSFCPSRFKALDRVEEIGRPGGMNFRPVWVLPRLFFVYSFCGLGVLISRIQQALLAFPRESTQCEWGLTRLTHI